MQRLQYDSAVNLAKFELVHTMLSGYPIQKQLPYNVTAMTYLCLMFNFTATENNTLSS